MSDAKDLRVLKKDEYGIESEIVTVRVGIRGRAFHVHKDLLTRSGYLRRLLAGLTARNITEDPELKIFCDKEYGASEFTMYVHYLYYGTIPCKAAPNPEIDDPFQEENEQEEIVKFYIMADYLEDVAAMDAAISSLLAVSGEHSSGDDGDGYDCVVPLDNVVQLAYDNTPVASPLRRLMVDLYLWGAPTHFIDVSLPSEFLADLARAALKRLDAKEPPNFSERVAQATCCDYHQHGDETICTSRKRKREDEDEDGEEEEEEVEDEDGEQDDSQTEDSE